MSMYYNLICGYILLKFNKNVIFIFFSYLNDIYINMNSKF